MCMTFFNPIPSISQVQRDVLASAGVVYPNIDYVVDVSVVLRLTNRDDEWYTPQNELWRPDSNMMQALELAQLLHVSVSINYTLNTVSLMDDTFHIECTCLDDKPQNNATFANQRTALMRNMARAITHSLLTILTYIES